MVDLPQPDGPRMELKAPFRTSNVMFSNTRRCFPSGNRYSFVTSCRVIAPTGLRVYKGNGTTHEGTHTRRGQGNAPPSIDDQHSQADRSRREHAVSSLSN